jgi:hypothetical protein
MKKLLIVLLVALALTLGLAGCRSTNDSDCQYNWGEIYQPGDDRAVIIQLVMNNRFPPDTVGDYLQQCLEDGWMPR